MPDVKSILIYALGACVVGLLLMVSGQRTQLEAEKTAHQATKTQHAEVLRDLAERTATAAKKTLEAKEAMVREVASIDTKHTKELTNAKREIGRLRTGLHDGVYGLRLQATCTSSGRGDMSKASSAASMDDAVSPRLTPDAEQAYFDHREAIEQVRSMVLGLQEYANAVQGVKP